MKQLTLIDLNNFYNVCRFDVDNIQGVSEDHLEILLELAGTVEGSFLLNVVRSEVSRRTSIFISQYNRPGGNPVYR